MRAVLLQFIVQQYDKEYVGLKDPHPRKTRKLK